MNLSQIRDLALKLSNSYSADGILLPPSDVSDFKLACADFVNTAQNLLAKYDKIEEILTIIQLTSDVGYILNPLPTDLIGINKVIFLDNYKHRTLFTDYTIEKGNIVIDGIYDGTFSIYYFKLPTDLVLDTDIPEANPSYHSYLAYYVAGEWLMSTGKESQGIIRLNQFDNYISNIRATINESNGILNSTGW